MIENYYLTKLVLAAVISTLLSTDIEGRAFELPATETSRLQAVEIVDTDSIPTPGYGKISHLPEISGALEHKTEVAGVKRKADETIPLLPKDELVRVSEKLMEATQWVLKYVSYDSRHGSSDQSESFSLKPMMKKDRTFKKDFDYNISLEVGSGQDPKDFISLNAIRISTQGFSTYLDAVYDCRNEALDFIFSNRHINAHLMDGMHLQFQVSPTKSAGAVLMMVSF